MISSSFSDDESDSRPPSPVDESNIVSGSPRTLEYAHASLFRILNCMSRRKSTRRVGTTTHHLRWDGSALRTDAQAVRTSGATTRPDDSLPTASCTCFLSPDCIAALGSVIFV